VAGTGPHFQNTDRNVVGAFPSRDDEPWFECFSLYAVHGLDAPQIVAKITAFLVPRYLVPIVAQGGLGCGFCFEQGTKVHSHLARIVGRKFDALVFGPAVPLAQAFPNVRVRSYDTIEEPESFEECSAEFSGKRRSIEAPRQNHNQRDIPPIFGHSIERERARIEHNERCCLVYSGREPRRNIFFATDTVVAGQVDAGY
jgi:hypothetical protein